MGPFEELMETIQIRNDSRSLQSLKRSLKQAEAGKLVSQKEVFGRGIVGSTRIRNVSRNGETD